MSLGDAHTCVKPVRAPSFGSTVHPATHPATPRTLANRASRVVVVVVVVQVRTGGGVGPSLRASVRAVSRTPCWRPTGTWNIHR